jgi:glutamyl-Q tRNA(Asp) synthetase
LAATPAQIRLARLLGRAEPPAFLHHPLIRRPDGRKLSKSSGDTGVRELRAVGLRPDDVMRMASRSARGRMPRSKTTSPRPG